ncbi:DUF3618 domain-containing protein [Planobispora longispora]|uniref:DUF3618 domain-containing protein n=1 Tax=Planobispora longispora TaxID=28887 RepID=A0A8J3W821_9ACTN|nr:DUF3618 domain-containing protein [Planobispora longispora]BFE83875.1 DUF3618 domain-containing protein [Planobispora longispora]GIH78391.1 hypothetical protein Plo01_48200 [Planobispora longispora]
MGAEPDEIRAEINATRAELAADVDRLAERTSPRRIAQRRTARMRQKMYAVRERVMGTPTHAAHRVREQAGQAAHSVRESASGAADTVKHGAQQAAETVKHGAHQATEVVKETPEQVMRSTQGNPLAAGMIAFGAGLLAATLLPRTEAENRAAEQLKEQAGDMVEPVKAALQESAQNLGQEAKGIAQEAAQQVKESATEAARTTGGQAREQAQQVTDQTRSRM